MIYQLSFMLLMLILILILILILKDKELHLLNCKRLHKELWLWIAANPFKSKYEWPRWKSNGGDIPKVDRFCFACEVSISCTDKCVIGDCKYDFNKWQFAGEQRERVYWATRIANRKWVGKKYTIIKETPCRKKD